MYNSVFFFNDTATTEIYTLSLHDALPIWFRNEAHEAELPPLRPARDVAVAQAGVRRLAGHAETHPLRGLRRGCAGEDEPLDRKSTSLNSSHANISYAVFCLEKKTTSILFP